MIRFLSLKAILLMAIAISVTSRPVYGFVKASELISEVDQSNYRERGQLGFVLPNENFPQDGDYHWKNAIKDGVYISVGTHRGIFGALATKSSHLVLVDTHANAVIYNQALILLLKVAKGKRLTFLHMMTNKRSFEQAVRKSVLPEQEKNWLQKIGKTNFWESVTYYQSKSRFFTEVPKTDGDEFYGHNYLRDNALFKRISDMAIENRIAAIQLDLSDPIAVGKLAEDLKKENLPVSFFDISNAWQAGKYSGNQYLGSVKTKLAIEALKPAMVDGSRVLLTAAHQNWMVSNYKHKGAILVRPRDELRFGYYSATLAELNEKNFFTYDIPTEEQESRSHREKFMKSYFRGTDICKRYLEGE